MATLLATGLLGSTTSTIAAPGNVPPAAPAQATLPATTCPLVGATRTCTLWATTGTLTLPGSVTVPIWGYSTSNTPGSATLPGPTLIVNQGEAVDIVLNNLDLPAVAGNTSLAFPQLSRIPDTTGVGVGGARTYSFSTTDLPPGTYLYEAGLTTNGQVQVAMGLFGALIVRPTACAACAYGPSSTYVDEALVVLSEIDPAFNTSANPTTFNLRDYQPKYSLINGEAYPDTDPIPTAAGNTVLLRYVNAGLENHSMGLLGLRQTVLATDGKPYTHPYRVVAETIPAGATLDTLSTIAATAPSGARYALYEAANRLDNSGARTGLPPTEIINFGGMLTFMTVSGTPPTGGPPTSNVQVSPNPTNGTVAVTLSATIGTSGGPTVTAAEYFVDAIGTNGSGCAITTGLGAPPANVSISIPTSGATAPCVDLATLSSGNHAFYVHGQDSSGWGPAGSVVLNLDKTGPATTNLGITPNPTNGTVDVTLQATGSDAASGGANVDAAEYFIDAACTNGAGTAITVASPGIVVNLNATIAAATVNGLAEGVHTISVHSHDVLGNWGACGSITLNVDKSGPATSAVSTTPNPTNGTIGVLVGVGSIPVHRIDATVTDPVAGSISSTLAGAEYFIDTVGANGTGGPFFSNAPGGTFNSSSVPVYATLPLFGIQALTQGQHTIHVHGRDVAGNWGAFETTLLNVDKTGPNTTLTSLAPNPTLGASSVSLAYTATDPPTGGTPAPAPASNIVTSEYFIGPDQGVGLGTLISPTVPATTVSLAATVPLTGLSFNSYLFSVRAKDAAGNWGPSATTLLNVLPADGIFADGFELGNFSAWNGGVTGSGLTTPRAAAMGATVFTNGFGMQAVISGGASGYVQDNTPTAQTSYRARFYFNPNGTPSGTGQQHDIFVALNTSNQTVFRIQYRRNSASGNLAQVRAVVSRNGGANNITNWFTINDNAANSIEVSWQVGGGAPFRLYVNGTLQQTLTVNTNNSALRVDTVRLGPQVGPALAVGTAPGTTPSLTGVSGTEYFDSFVSRSSSNSLIGP